MRVRFFCGGNGSSILWLVGHRPFQIAAIIFNLNFIPFPAKISRFSSPLTLLIIPISYIHRIVSLTVRTDLQIICNFRISFRLFEKIVAQVVFLFTV